MKNFKKLDDTYVLRLDIGQEICSEIKKLCIENGIQGGYVQGIGFADNIKIGTYNTEKQDYNRLSVNEGCEITSLCGNITTKGEDLIVHLHANFSKENGEIVGGHLFEATVALTAEIFICKTDKIQRSVETHRLIFE